MVQCKPVHAGDQIQGFPWLNHFTRGDAIETASTGHVWGQSASKKTTNATRFASRDIRRPSSQDVKEIFEIWEGVSNIQTPDALLVEQKLNVFVQEKDTIFKSVLDAHGVEGEGALRQVLRHWILDQGG